MAWQRVSLVVAGRQAEEVAEALEAQGAVATELTDADAGTAAEEAVFGEPGAETTPWKRCLVAALFPEEAAADEAVARALETSGATVLAGASIELTIDPHTYSVRLKGRRLDLTYKEFELLRFLARHPGRVFTRDRLLREVWGFDYFGGHRTVDVHVRRLRAKLGTEYESMIGTVRQVGYKLMLPPPKRMPAADWALESDLTPVLDL